MIRGEIASKKIAVSFSHPDFTVGPGNEPGLPLRLAGFTAGGESHPALKINLLSILYTKLI
jgi:hypothetical protein